MVVDPRARSRGSGAGRRLTLDPGERQAVRERALRLLARREHTVRELGNKLRSRMKVDDSVIRTVIQEMADEDLVSDERFAEAFARQAIERKPRALGFVVRELVDRGVPMTTAADSAEAAFSAAGVDDRVLAERAATACLSRISDLAPERRQRRLSAHLQRRGFAASLVRDLCERLLPAP